MADRFDPAKDAVNQEKHRLSLAFGDRIFEDDNHLHHSVYPFVGW